MLHLFKPKRFVYENDEQLVEALRKNNEAAIKYVFYDHYRSRLKQKAKERVRAKPIEYDDLIQELYLYFAENNWKRLEQFVPKKGKFENWFICCADRFFKDCSKKWSYNSIDLIGEFTPDNPIVNRKTSLSDWNDTELMRDLLRVLPSLEPKYERDIVTALIVNDEDPKEVAKRYGKTVEQIQRTKRYALAKLTRNLLKGYRDK